MSIATDRDERAEAVAPQPQAAMPATPPAPAPVPTLAMPPWKASLYIISSILLFVTQGLGMNIVTANLYQLQGDFSATVTEIVWMSAAYMAPYASLSIALFKIRAQYGLRRFAELSILVFVFASCLNLFVTDLHSAIVVRFVSGMAAAPMSTLGFLYMLEAFPPSKKMSLGLSFALMNALLAAPLARLVSPSLMDIGGWHGLYTLEVALALMVLPAIYLLPLTAPPRVKVIERMDILSYLLLASSFGCLAFFFSLARFYWWLDTQWLGELLAVAIALMTLLVFIELPRKNPFLDLRLILTRENMHMAAVLLLFRTVTSEQSSTASSFYQQLGLLNDQTTTLYLIILLSSIAGGLFCARLMITRYVETAHVIALMLIAAGAYMDSLSTSLTRPEQMYLSQAMIAFGAAMFLPPVMAKGFGGAMAKGLPHLVNFIAIFLFTQISGALMATAALGTFVTIREKFHSNVLAEHILLTDPLVAQRVSQLSSAYSTVITDKTVLNAEGLSLLSQQVTREAYVLAYADTFLVIAVLTTIALAFLLLHLGWLRWKALSNPAPDAAAVPQS